MQLPKRCRSLLFGVISLTILLQNTIAHTQVAEFRSQFRAGQCEPLIDPLKRYRSQLRELGRINLQVDYMLSVCLCRLPGLVALRQLPRVYRHLTREDQQIIEQSVSSCNRGGGVMASMPSRSAMVSGKGDSAENIRELRLPDEIADMYSGRIFDHDRKDDAVTNLRSRGFHSIVLTQNFVLTGDIGKPVLKTTGQLMEEVLESFIAQFGFVRPRTLITVYLFEDREMMQRHAREEHGVEIPERMLAYTFPHDASITIWVSSGMGTVGHEVFHALLDQNAPYAPPWLNEGTAALFEEFQTIDNRIEGTFRPNHWRVQYLRRPKQIPLTDLLAMDWHTFDGRGSLQQNHATAKFFSMYLQENQKLQEVLNEYVVHDSFDSSKDKAILENHLGKDLNLIAEDFAKWLITKIDP